MKVVTFFDYEIVLQDELLIVIKAQYHIPRKKL